MPRTVASGGFPELTSGLSTEELLKRLKACHSKLDQDNVEVSDLQGLADTLLKPFLYSHRSQEVKAHVACCIANVFRVSFPQPPYDEAQRKAVFQIFIDQFRKLEKPTSPAFKHSFKLLETVASIGLFNLCLEMDDQDILADVFRVLFSIINDELSSKVRGYIIDILSGLVQGGDSLPQVVMDIMLTNILEPRKSENKAAYSFTMDFIRKTSSHIEPYIHLFFNNALDVGKDSESEVADRLYDLILELHAIDSSVLLAVMPQLEFKLKSTDVEERGDVTKLLAAMFAPKSSKLATENRSLWNGFLGRFSDVSPHIRCECVHHCKFYLLNHPSLVEDITVKLHDRFYDKEERVRMEVVKTVCEVAAENFDAIPKALRDDLEGRMRDKVWSIRKETISNLAKIYRQIMSSSFSSGGDPSSSYTNHLRWIPTKILHSYYRETMEDRLCVERCLLSCIVPITLPDKERMQRLLQVYNSLSDEHAIKAFDHLFESRHRIRSFLRDLIEIQQNKNIKGDALKQAILTKTLQLSRHLPDSHKAQPYLDYLVKSMSDEKLRENLLKSIDTSYSCAEVVKAKGAVIEAVRSKTGLLDTVRNMLDRACPMLIDAKCIEVLVDLVCTALDADAEGDEVEFEQAKKALQLVKVLAGIMPANFSSSEVLDQLTVLLEHVDKTIVKSSLQILTLIGSHIDQRTASCLQPTLIEMALEGEPSLTKDTVKCLHQVFGRSKSVMEKLFSALLSRLEYGSENFATVLISLGQVAKLQPKIFATKHKLVVSDCIIKKLVCKDREEDSETVDGEWAADDALSYETKMKVLGVKLLVNWLLGLALSASEECEKKSKQVLQLLDFTLAHDGDLQAEGKLSPCACSRLRLASARGLLKLAKCPAYRDLIPLPTFLRLSLTVQDTCEEVRDRFMEKLNKTLSRLELPLSYLAIMVYAGIEPSKAIHSKFRKMLSTNILKRRQFVSQHPKAKEKPEVFLPEYSIPYAVYLVAHHQEFSRTSKRRLDTFKECLWFFLEPLVVRGASYGLIDKLLATMKESVDAQAPGDSESNKNLYATCDLATGIMASKLPHMTGEYSGEVVLPKKLFQPSGKPNTMRYLPPEYDCTPSKRQKTDVVIDSETTAKRHKSKSKSPSREPAKTGGRKQTASKPVAKAGGRGKKEQPAGGRAKAGKKGGATAGKASAAKRSVRNVVTSPDSTEDEAEPSDSERSPSVEPAKTVAKKQQQPRGKGRTTGKKAEVSATRGSVSAASVRKSTRRKQEPEPEEDEKEETEAEAEEGSGTEEVSEELPPAPKRTRGRVTRRKQEPQVDDEVAEEVEDESPPPPKKSRGRVTRRKQEPEVAEEEEESLPPTTKRTTRGRNTKRKQEPEVNEEEENEEEVDAEQSPPPPKKASGRVTRKKQEPKVVEEEEVTSEADKVDGEELPPPPKKTRGRVTRRKQDLKEVDEEEKEMSEADSEELPPAPTKQTRGRGARRKRDPEPEEEEEDEGKEEGSEVGNEESPPPAKKTRGRATRSKPAQVDQEQSPEEATPAVVEDNQNTSHIKRRARHRR